MMPQIPRTRTTTDNDDVIITNNKSSVDLAAVLLEHDVIAPYSMYKICKLHPNNSNNSNNSNAKHYSSSPERQEAEFLYVIFHKFCSPHPTVDQLQHILQYCHKLLLQRKDYNHNNYKQKKNKNVSSSSLPQDITLHPAGSDAVIRMLQPQVLLHPLLCRQHKVFQLAFVYVLLRLLTGEDQMQFEAFMKIQVLHLGTEDDENNDYDQAQGYSNDTEIDDGYEDENKESNGLCFSWIMSDFDDLDILPLHTPFHRTKLEQTLHRVATTIEPNNKPERASRSSSSSVRAMNNPHVSSNRRRQDTCTTNDNVYYTVLRFLSCPEWTAFETEEALQCRSIQRRPEFGVQRLFLGKCAAFDLKQPQQQSGTAASEQYIRRDSSELNTNESSKSHKQPPSIEEVGLLGLLLNLKPDEPLPLVYEKDDEDENDVRRLDQSRRLEDERNDGSNGLYRISDFNHHRQSSSIQSYTDRMEIKDTAHLIAPLCRLIAIFSSTGYMPSLQVKKLLELIHVPYTPTGISVSNGTSGETFTALGPITKLHLLHILQCTLNDPNVTPTPYTPAHCFTCTGASEGITCVYDASTHQSLYGTTIMQKSSGINNDRAHIRSIEDSASSTPNASMFANEYGFSAYFRAEYFPTPDKSTGSKSSPTLFRLERYSNETTRDSGRYVAGVELSLETVPQYTGPAVATLVLNILDPSDTHKQREGTSGSSSDQAGKLVRDGAGNVREGQRCVKMTCCVVTPKVWHHVAVRHTKHKSRTLRNFFSKSHMVDELTIYFDHRPLLRTHLRYPKYLPSTSQFSDKVSTSKPVSGGFYKVQIGSNFDGALGGIGLTMGIEGEQQGGEHVFLNTVLNDSPSLILKAQLNSSLSKPEKNQVAKALHKPLLKAMHMHNTSTNPDALSKIAMQDSARGGYISNNLTSNTINSVLDEDCTSIPLPYIPSGPIISSLIPNTPTKIHYLLHYTPQRTKYVTSTSQAVVLDLPPLSSTPTTMLGTTLSGSLSTSLGNTMTSALGSAVESSIIGGMGAHAIMDTSNIFVHVRNRASLEGVGGLHGVLESLLTKQLIHSAPSNKILSDKHTSKIISSHPIPSGAHLLPSIINILATLQTNPIFAREAVRVQCLPRLFALLRSLNDCPPQIVKKRVDAIPTMIMQILHGNAILSHALLKQILDLHSAILKSNVPDGVIQCEKLLIWGMWYLPSEYTTKAGTRILLQSTLFTQILHTWSSMARSMDYVYLAEDSEILQTVIYHLNWFTCDVNNDDSKTNLSSESRPIVGLDRVYVIDVLCGILVTLLRKHGAGIGSVLHLIASYATILRDIKSDEIGNTNIPDTDVYTNSDRASKHMNVKPNLSLWYIYTTLWKLLRMLLYLLENFMHVPDLYSTLRDYCSRVLKDSLESTSSLLGGNTSVTEGASRDILPFATYILVHIVHQRDDTLRALGVRVLIAYLDCDPSKSATLTSPTGVVGNPLPPVFRRDTSEDLNAVSNKTPSSKLASSPISTSKSTSSKSISRISSKGANKGYKDVYKLLWHLLKLHTQDFADETYAALLELLLTTSSTYASETSNTFSGTFAAGMADISVVGPSVQQAYGMDQIVVPSIYRAFGRVYIGYVLNPTWPIPQSSANSGSYVKHMSDDCSAPGILPATPSNSTNSSVMHIITNTPNCTLRSAYTTQLLLRLLQHLPHSIQERWLFDFLTLIRIQANCLVGLTGITLDGTPVVTMNTNRAVATVASSGGATSSVTDAARLTLAVEQCVGDWATCLFGILCEIVESSQCDIEQDTDAMSASDHPIPVRYDLCTKLYATLLAHTLRTGGDTAVHTLEYVCALSQSSIYGDLVLCIVLSYTLTELIESGSVPLEVLHGAAIPTSTFNSVSTSSTSNTHSNTLINSSITSLSGSARVHATSHGTVSGSNQNMRNKALKESARIVTSSFGSNGSKEMDFRSAVKQWRFLRHLTAVVVCLVCKTGYGVPTLLTSLSPSKSSIVTMTHELPLTPRSSPLCCVLHLSSTLLTLLDAFIFPDEDGLAGGDMDAMVYGLALVKPVEPRIGTQQGPLLASLLHLSLLFMAHTPTRSLKFREAASRLRCLFHWALEVIRETCVVGIGSGTSPGTMGATAFHKLTKILDGLVVGVVLVCHRCLYKIENLLTEIETQIGMTNSDIGSINSQHTSTQAQQIEEHRQKRRLFLSAMEVREIILEAFRRRSEVLREALSLQAYEALQSALEDQARGNVTRRQASSSDISRQIKEEGIRRFMQQEWVQSFRDDVMYKASESSHADSQESSVIEGIAIPIMMSNAQVYKHHTSTTRGRDTILSLHTQTTAILEEYRKVLNSKLGGFESYLRHQRAWKGDADSVRFLEYTGEVCAQGLLLHIESTHITDGSIVPNNYSMRLHQALQLLFARVLQYTLHISSALHAWSVHYTHRSTIRDKFAPNTDTLFRRIVLVPDFNPVNYEEHRYDKTLGTGSATKPVQHIDLSNVVVRRNVTTVEVEESDSEDESDMESDDGENIEGQFSSASSRSVVKDETQKAYDGVAAAVGGRVRARRLASMSVRADIYKDAQLMELQETSHEPQLQSTIELHSQHSSTSNAGTCTASVESISNDVERDISTNSFQSVTVATNTTSEDMNPITLETTTATEISNPLNTQYLYPNERAVHIIPYTATRITLQYTIEGMLTLTTHALYFCPTSAPASVMTGYLSAEKEDDREHESKKYHGAKQIWRLDKLSKMLGRRYLMRQQALELFFVDNCSVLLYFTTGQKYRDEVYNKIRTVCHVPLLRTLKDKRRVLMPRQVYKRSTAITNLWRKRQISNFDYLMQLNILSGRSFNDITQYPIFPWVLTDYESNSIDLNDSAVYRDLSKPIGALNPSRLEMLIERYNDLDGFGEERFLYGSHYSSPGVVLHFLIRQEPFTSMSVELQSGRFDVPDRLFFDIAQCWRGCMNSTSDVKELVPEFYTCPEIFLNTNNLPLGKMQDGRKIHNVRLPPWAHGSAYEFVRIHRAALESEYVTQHLHHWIDLVFGYKQRGPAAVTANNLFHPLSYEGAVDFDLDTSLDEVDRLATEAHIQNFGQTPSQLILHEPHPVRYSAPIVQPLPLSSSLYTRKDNDRDDKQKYVLNSYRPPRQYGGKHAHHGAILDIYVISDTVIAIHADLTVATYKWAPRQHGGVSSLGGRGIFPFTWKKDKLRQLFMTTNGLNSEKDNQTQSTCCARLYQPMEPGSGLFSEGLLIAHDKHGTVGTFGSTEGSRENMIPPYLYRYDGTPNQFCVGLVSGTSSSNSHLVTSGYFDDSIKIHAIDGAMTGGSLALKCEATAMLDSNAHNTDDLASGASCRNYTEDASVPITDLIIDVVDHSFMATGDIDGIVRIWCINNPPLAAALTDAYVETMMSISTSGIMSPSKSASPSVFQTNGITKNTIHHHHAVSRSGSTNIRTSNTSKYSGGFSLQMLHVLSGHSSAIACLAMNSDLDVIVSGSANGTLCIHSIRSGTFIRSIRFGDPAKGVSTSSIRRLALSANDGTIIIHLSDGRLLSCTVNGLVLASIGCSDNIITMQIITGENGHDDVLLTGGETGVLYFRLLHSLELMHSIDISYHGPVQCIALTEKDSEHNSSIPNNVNEKQHQQFLFVGSDDGMISIIANPNPFQR